jgi:hypothetical protein
MRFYKKTKKKKQKSWQFLSLRLLASRVTVKKPSAKVTDELVQGGRLRRSDSNLAEV